jgi:hypothetical protein
MKKIFLLTLFITTVNIAQDSYHKGHYVDIDNRKFDVQIKDYGFDDNITSLYYKENDSEQELSLPIEQVELFTYKKGREIFIFREVNIPNEKGEESLENSNKIIMQLIASGVNTSLFLRKYKDEEEFFYIDNYKEVNQLIDSTYKKILSSHFKLDEEEVKDYTFDKVSLTLLTNYINSFNLSVKTKTEIKTNAIKVEPNENFQAPVFAGCKKNSSNEEKIKCLNKGFSMHFSKKFNPPEIVKNNYSNLRILLYFVIEKNGKISLRNVMNSPVNELTIEMFRVFDLLPIITPAFNEHNAMKLKYMMPFNLKFE